MRLPSPPLQNWARLIALTAMRQIWSLALDCLTKLTILTKHERILISYKFFHIKAPLRAKKFMKLTHFFAQSARDK